MKKLKPAAEILFSMPIFVLVMIFVSQNLFAASNEIQVAGLFDKLLKVSKPEKIVTNNKDVSINLQLITIKDLEKTPEKEGYRDLYDLYKLEINIVSSRGSNAVKGSNSMKELSSDEFDQFRLDFQTALKNNKYFLLYELINSPEEESFFHSKSFLPGEFRSLHDVNLETLEEITHGHKEPVVYLSGSKFIYMINKYDSIEYGYFIEYIIFKKDLSGKWRPFAYKKYINRPDPSTEFE